MDSASQAPPRASSIQADPSHRLVTSQSAPQLQAGRLAHPEPDTPSPPLRPLGPALQLHPTPADQDAKRETQSGGLPHAMATFCVQPAQVLTEDTDAFTLLTRSAQDLIQQAGDTAGFPSGDRTPQVPPNTPAAPDDPPSPAPGEGAGTSNLVNTS